MHAARQLHERSGEERWLKLWRQSAERLLRAWDGESNLWTQDLYGSRAQYLGPAHGFAGCVLALSAEPTDELSRRATEVVRREAVEEHGLANWPPVAASPLEHPRTGEIRVQWCHGAPGIVASLAGLAGGPELDRLLLAGGELTWRAGPLHKGANLCHGTAGNGYAFLALLERTGDELWLARARAFAMHALAQVEEMRSRLRRGRYTLWTGDPGTALYLADCLAGENHLPLP
jgi:lantibiotic modifying enzyme